jgi:hypothetical protein
MYANINITLLVNNVVYTQSSNNISALLTRHHQTTPTQNVKI